MYLRPNAGIRANLSVGKHAVRTFGVRELQQQRQAAGPALVLERSLGKRANLDADLWNSVPFSAEVIPDLPIASSWSGLYQSAIHRLLRMRPSSSFSTFQPAQDHANHENTCSRSTLCVRTIAAQAKSYSALEAKMLESVIGQHHQRKADAILCVSGSHFARRLPGSDRFLQNSFSILQMAAHMKRQGQLPENLALWAVENPLTNSAERLNCKAAAGATVVVTQPPLIWDKFEAWYDQVYRSGITQDVSIVVGLPFVTSTASLQFWMTLCDAWSVEGATTIVEKFQENESKGKPAMQAFLRSWNSQLIDKVRELPGLSGMHVMPLSKPARRLASDLLL